MQEKYSSRKFLLTCSSFVVASAALFSGHLTGSEWAMANAAILGLYKFANVQESKQ